MLRTFITIILVFCSVFLLGQKDISNRVRRVYNTNIKPDRIEAEKFALSLKNINVETGLIQSQVYACIQDSRGFMWYGTFGGVTKYDGTNLVHYNAENGLVNDVINVIFEDSKGNIWFGTDMGVSRYDGVKFKNFTLDNGLKSEIIESILEDDEGNIYFGCYEGLHVLRSNGKLDYYYTESGLPETDIRTGIKIGAKSFLYGTKKGLYEFDGSRFVASALNAHLADSSVSWLLKSKEGTLYIGTREGLYHYQNQKMGVYKEEDGLSSNNIYSVGEDSKGTIWVCTRGSGLNKLKNGQFTTFTTENGLSNNIVYVVTEDDEGNLWFGTDAGTDKYSGETFLHYGANSGLSHNIVWAIEEDDKGNIWIGTEEGLSIYNGNSFAHYNSDQNFRKESVYILKKSKTGGMWIGLYDGLVEFDGNAWITYEEDEILSNQGVFSVFEDDENRVWIGTRGGVIMRDGEKYLHYTTDQGLNDNDVYNITGDHLGNIWFATDHGACKFDGNQFIKLNKSDGFSDNMVHAVLEDKNKNLWFAVYGEGLFVLKAEFTDLIGKKKNLPFHVINATNGLPDNGVYLLIEDKDGNIWTGGNKGATRVNPAFLEDNQDHASFVKVFAALEGYVGLESNQNAGYCDSKGNIWFGCAERMTKYNPKEDWVNTKEPRTSVNNIRMFYEQVDWVSNQNNGIVFSSVTPWRPLPQDLELSYYQNHLTFEFSGTSLKVPEKVRYQWKLDPYDKHWSPVSNKTEATYSNISPGTYTFYLRAANDEGVWNKEPVIYKFIVHPPWWLTWWAYLSYIVFAVVGIYGFITWRTAKLKARQRELAEEVRIKTKEVVQERDEAQKQKKVAEEQRKIAEEQTLLVEEKNKLIVDSITYAKRIQRAILPSLVDFEHFLSDYFVMYKPKDIVAGDFYWIERVENRIFFSAADCTGHGVPGAMLSVVCSNALTKCVKELNLLSPADILNETSRIVESRFAHSKDVEDGMDLAMCCIDLDAMTLEFSGAHNPAWIYRKTGTNGSTKLHIEELKANRQPIGKFVSHEPFENHTRKLEKGDTVYIFSDGYVDQPGGPKQKKFLSLSFKKLLADLQELSLKDQMKQLDLSFEEWKGEYEQIDDVCVIGVKL